MNKKLLFALTGLVFSLSISAQFSTRNIRFWIGSGTDTTMLVVDFNDGTGDSSYAWGYAHDGTATGEDLLNDVAAADANFSVNISGGLLNDVYYNDHEGVANSPGYWATWDGPNLGNLSTNGGISDQLVSDGWFGLMYDDFNTAPGEPVPAYDPEAFTIDDATFFVGSGNDTALLVIDFREITEPASFAWGYIFNDSTTGEEMLQDISDADPLLDVVLGGGMLQDITYQVHSGIGGSPHYWATWSATNYGNWHTNAGIGTSVKPGELFGVSYTDFDPALRPDIPAAAVNTIGLNELQSAAPPKIYPQPTSENLWVEMPDGFFEGAEILLYNMSGSKVLSQKATGKKERIDVSGLPSGVYILKSAGHSQKILVN